jgi:hypothetical protein
MKTDQNSSSLRHVRIVGFDPSGILINGNEHSLLAAVLPKAV